MSMGSLSRRGFVQRSVAGLVGAGLPLWYAREAVEGRLIAAEEEKKPGSDALRVGLIGCGGQGRHIMKRAKSNKGVQVVALCDVDQNRREDCLGKDLGGSKDVKLHGDFRKLLDDKSIDAVLIGTPDHWHAQVAVEAMRKGKDVYCEKPLTLTIDEGKAIVKVAKATKRIFQVGSQQRSEGPFRLACELVRNGRIGKIQTIETWIGSNPTGGPFPTASVPKGLDWNFWLGPTPKVDFVKERCFYNFRWWYDYSGGKMTDWGAHHNDIAQWALGMDDSGPISVESVAAPASKKPNSYNCNPTFDVTYTYASGAKVHCKSKENGVLLEGEGGKWIFVSRSGIMASDSGAEKPTTGKGLVKGKASKIIDTPLGKDAIRLYHSSNHMTNWLGCIRSRKQTVCPAEVGHRSVTVCHLGTINMRLGGKKMGWDPVTQKFDDEAANAMMSRPRRGEWKLEA